MHLSAETIRKDLEKVPRSNKPATDGIPPLLLKTNSEHLSPFVDHIFAYITSTLICPDIWKCAFVTLIHKKEAVLIFEITDQSRFYPGTR